MSTFSERLREERQRLGLNQTDFAAVGGVQKRAQINYEAGERSPDSVYLAAIAAAGADVMYLLSGQRNAPVAQSLSRRAASLVDNYEHTDEAGKKIIEGTAALAAQSKAKKA